MNAIRPHFARALALLTLMALAACSQPAGTSGSDSRIDAAPDSSIAFKQVADFEFTERSGRTVSAHDMLGEVWIVGFFFTRCAGPCPKLSTNMSSAQTKLAESGVQLVSISVDPNFDTPEVLAEYAQHYQADEDRWLFLSGPEQATFDLMQNSFVLGVSTNMDEIAALRVTHATKLVVVDRAGVIRGYYDGESEAGVNAAIARAQWLDQNTTKDGQAR